MATSYYARLNTNKLKADLARAIKSIGIDSIEEGLTAGDKIAIGDELISAMKDQIAKGISPIQGFGRFPAYKWVARGNRVSSKATAIKGNSIRARSTRAQYRALAKETKRQGYPYTVRKRFPSKRERPVNLYLSGSMMNNLTVRPARQGGLTGGLRRRVLYYGYFDRLSALKEEGHRVGVNGQPPRPTIPVGNEQLNRTVYNRLIVAISRRIRAGIQRSLHKSFPI